VTGVGSDCLCIDPASIAVVRPNKGTHARDSPQLVWFRELELELPGAFNPTHIINESDTSLQLLVFWSPASGCQNN